MADLEQVKILKRGVKACNQWRAEQGHGFIPDLENADLVLTELQGAYLDDANLRQACLSGAKLQKAYLQGANLTSADLGNARLEEAFVVGANLSSSNLEMADLERARMPGCNFTDARLMEADLSEADLTRAIFTGADLTNANLAQSYMRETRLEAANLQGAVLYSTVLLDCFFKDTDFSSSLCGNTLFASMTLYLSVGLESIRHGHPSKISTDSFSRSDSLPRVFLEGCGVPKHAIEYIPSVFQEEQPIQFYSSFISYSQKDKEFVSQLYTRLREEQIQVWSAPENMKGGQEIYSQIDEAIRMYDKLLLVLSEHSMSSNWVETEIRKALEKESREKHTVLFPIRLVELKVIQKWV